MEKIFVLDDDINRINWFFKKWDNVKYAMDPEAAETILSAHEFDIIFLDHDLGGPYTRGPLGDGIDLAEVMAEKKIHIDTPIIIHSQNFQGALDIEAALQKTHKLVLRINWINLKNFHRIDLREFIAEELRIQNLIAKD